MGLLLPRDGYSSLSPRGVKRSAGEGDREAVGGDAGEMREF